LEGRDAAAGYTLRQDQRTQGVPPNWMIYITWTALIQAAAKASSSRYSDHAALRTSWIWGDGCNQDPTGAHFCVWQARKNTGIGIAGVAGSLCWADLITPDAKRAGDFYSGFLRLARHSR